MAFEIRVRNWWKPNPDWPDGLEPDSTPFKRGHKVGTASTEEEARAFCNDWNASHNPGRLSRKAEFSEIR